MSESNFSDCWAKAAAMLGPDTPCPHGLAAACYCGRCIQPIAAQFEAEKDVESLTKRLAVLEAERQEDLERLDALEAAMDRIFGEGGPGSGNKE